MSIHLVDESICCMSGLHRQFRFIMLINQYVAWTSLKTYSKKFGFEIFTTKTEDTLNLDMSQDIIKEIQI